MTEKYDIITTPKADGTAIYRRVSDGKVAVAKVSWFKSSPYGIGLIPASRTKALRIGGLKWEPETVLETTTETTETK